MADKNTMNDPYEGGASSSTLSPLSDRSSSLARTDGARAGPTSMAGLRSSSFSSVVNLDFKSPAQYIVDFLTKLKHEKKLASPEVREVDILIQQLASMRNLWAPRDLEVLDDQGRPVDVELKQFIADTLANPAEQLPGTVQMAPPTSTRRPSVLWGSSQSSHSKAPQESGGVADFNPVTLEVLETTHQWLTFDAFKVDKACNGKGLSCMGLFLFKWYDFHTTFQFDLAIAAKALRRWEENYHPNPYHNRWHACDVTQACHYMLSAGGMGRLLTPFESFALLTAAIIHDLDHPGTNNAFQVATRSWLGLRYNDRSVLENHHVASAFEIVWGQGSECDFLAGLTAEERKDFRKIVIELVLGTDLAVSFDIINHFKVELDRGRYQALLESLDSEDTVDVEQISAPEDRLLLMKMMIKCADISHTARPLDYHLTWSNNVTREFWEQGDREHALSLPVAAFMDRHSGGLAKSQAGFMQYVAKPMWVPLWGFMREPYMEEHIDANTEHWISEARKAELVSSPDGASSARSAAVSRQTPSPPHLPPGGFAKDTPLRLKVCPTQNAGGGTVDGTAAAKEDGSGADGDAGTVRPQPLVATGPVTLNDTSDVGEPTTCDSRA